MKILHFILILGVPLNLYKVPFCFSFIIISFIIIHFCCESCEFVYFCDCGSEIHLWIPHLLNMDKPKKASNRRNLCSYYNCKNSLSKNPNIHLYRFPKDEKRHNQWIVNSGKWLSNIFKMLKFTFFIFSQLKIFMIEIGYGKCMIYVCWNLHTYIPKFCQIKPQA